MARSRLSLVIVFLLVASRFLNTSQNDSDCSSEETDNWDWQSGKSYLCVTLVEPGCKNVTIGFKDKELKKDSFMVNPGECTPKHTDVLKVQAMKGGYMNLYLKMSLGDCDATCLITKELSDPPKLSVTDNEKKKVLCEKADLPPINIDTKDDHGLCTNGRILNRTPPTEPPLSSTKSSVAPEGYATNLTNPPAPVMPKPSSPAVLEIVLVLELVATCVMAVLVVWVMRSGGRKSGVSPATTDVRRNSHQGEVYICENDLYEPFTGPAAAQATGGQT